MSDDQNQNEKNDRIEAAVIIAALASLALLVSLAVATSVSSVSGNRPAGIDQDTAAETLPDNR